MLDRDREPDPQAPPFPALSLFGLGADVQEEGLNEPQRGGVREFQAPPLLLVFGFSVRPTPRAALWTVWGGQAALELTGGIFL